MKGDGQMAMDSFENASDLRPGEGGHWTGTFPDGWQQGKGAFGGLVLGILARGSRAAESDPTRQLRSLSGDLCGPALVGEFALATTVLRRGRKQTNVRVDMRQGQSLVATASVLLSEERDRADDPVTPAPPSEQDWRQVPVVPLAPPFAPVFTPHYEYRSSGPFPLMGEDPGDMKAPFPPGETHGWVRSKTNAPWLDEASLMGLLDSWWPAIFTIRSRYRPIATVRFTADIFCDPRQISAQEPLRYRGRVMAARHGFMLEVRELWKEDQLLAVNHQTMVFTDG